MPIPPFEPVNRGAAIPSAATEWPSAPLAAQIDFAEVERWRSTDMLLLNVEVNLCGSAILGYLLAVQFHL